VYPTKFLPERKHRQTPESTTSSILNRKPSQVPNRMNSQKSQTPYPYQENPERHVPNSVPKSVEIHQEVTTKLTESQARSSSYPSNFHPERKPSQVPKDTNKQTHTHTHTRGQQREGSWTERSAFRSQPRCSRTITNEFPDCSRAIRPSEAKTLEGQMGQWSTHKMVNGFRTCRTEDGVEREASTILRWRIGRMGWTPVP
jgi:hypothetical protein